MDWQRAERTGMSEAVLCTGKSIAQLQEILRQTEHRQMPLLFTRLDGVRFDALGTVSGQFDYDAVSATARYLPPGYEPEPLHCRIAVITGGTSDIPVAREAARTLAFHGNAASEIHDLGVAGLWRIQAQLDRLREQQIIICAAGMDAALPTVLAGLVPALVIAVPTSAGYGMARAGETALHALLCSCAQGLVVVNIDNGFGAACAALRAARGMAANRQQH
jgi:NCAIR mutase (PurE)-related protein